MGEARRDAGLDFGDLARAFQETEADAVTLALAPFRLRGLELRLAFIKLQLTLTAEIGLHAMILR